VIPVVIASSGIAVLLAAALAPVVLPGDPGLAAGSRLGSSRATIHVAPHPTPTVWSVRPDVGPASGGQSVAVTGTGFVRGSSLEIGQGKGAGPTAIAATKLVVVSNTEITATTGGPARAGTWNLFVISSGETSRADLGDHYRYEIPKPSCPPRSSLRTGCHSG
jgi:hypothetical protein